MKRIILAIIGCVIILRPILSIYAEQQTWVIGVENQTYLPIFANENGEYKGFARELLDSFAQDHGYKFIYRPLPVLRLYASFFGKEIDFKFPDNPNWKKDQRLDKNILYSNPVLEFIDGVSVLPEKKNTSISDIHILGTVAGFTPWAWMDQIQAGKVTLSENSSFESLVRQTLVGRIDGAYASLAVVNYQLDNVLKKSGALVFNPNLPYSRDNYYLSTIKHSALINQFNSWMSQNQIKFESLKRQHNVEKGVRE